MTYESEQPRADQPLDLDEVRERAEDDRWNVLARDVLALLDRIQELEAADACTDEHPCETCELAIELADERMRVEELTAALERIAGPPWPAPGASPAGTMQGIARAALAGKEQDG